MDSVSESQPDQQSGQPAEAQPVETRMISEIDSLRALADPTRLAILTTLMESRAELPVMSAKELAARLDQPQTKLYRHLRQLESAGLIVRSVDGRVHQCSLAAGPLQSVEVWLGHYRRFWEGNLDALARFVERPGVQRRTRPRGKHGR